MWNELQVPENNNTSNGGVRRRTNSFKKWISANRSSEKDYAVVASTESLTELVNPESEEFVVEKTDSNGDRLGIEVILDVSPEGIKEKTLKTKQVERFHPMQTIADYGYNGNADPIPHFFISVQVKPGVLEKRYFITYRNGDLFEAFRTSIRLALDRVKERAT